MTDVSVRVIQNTDPLLEAIEIIENKMTTASHSRLNEYDAGYEGGLQSAVSAINELRASRTVCVVECGSDAADKLHRELLRAADGCDDVATDANLLSPAELKRQLRAISTNARMVLRQVGVESGVQCERPPEQVDQAERWNRVQDLALAVASKDDPPSEIESALCWVVCRLREEDEAHARNASMVEREPMTFEGAFAGQRDLMARRYEALRHRIAAGESVGVKGPRFVLPLFLEEYAREHDLYRGSVAQHLDAALDAYIAKPVFPFAERKQ